MSNILKEKNLNYLFNLSVKTGLISLLFITFFFLPHKTSLADNSLDTVPPGELSQSGRTSTNRSTERFESTSDQTQATTNTTSATTNQTNSTSANTSASNVQTGRKLGDLSLDEDVYQSYSPERVGNIPSQYVGGTLPESGNAPLYKIGDYYYYTTLTSDLTPQRILADEEALSNAIKFGTIDEKLFSDNEIQAGVDQYSEARNRNDTEFERVAEQNAQAQAGATADAAAAGRCIWGEASFSPINIHWGNCFSIATYYIASALGLGVGVSANVLEKVTTETVVNMSANISQIGVVDDAWKIFRDFANIAFIFALLYLSIQIILGIGSGHGKMIGRVVVVALLINFSLFFTKVVIDAGNIAALQFYNAITTTPGGQSTDLGSTFVGTLGLQSAFKEIQVGGAGGDNAAQGFAQAQSGIGTGARFALLAGVTVMLLVALFVFFAASIVLLMRFIILVVLMVTAPLAFVAYILPQTEPKAKEWWKKLISETFFVVTFFGILWLVAAVISSGGFKSMLGIVNGADLSNMFTETGDEKGQSIGAIVNFILVIGFLVYALKAGKDLGNGAGEMVNKWGSGLSKWGRGVVGRRAGSAVFGTTSWAGRNTVGRVSKGIAKGLENNTGIASTFIRKRALGLAKNSMDFRATSVGKNLSSTLGLGEAGGKGGYEGVLKQKKQKIAAYADTLGSDESKKKYLEAKWRNVPFISTPNRELREDIQKTREKAQNKSDEAQKKLLNQESLITTLENELNNLQSNTGSPLLNAQGQPIQTGVNQKLIQQKTEELRKSKVELTKMQKALESFSKEYEDLNSTSKVIKKVIRDGAPKEDKK